MDIKTKDNTWVVRTKCVPHRTFRDKLALNNMAICSDHADSFKINHFDWNLHLIFYMKVNNDVVFEAIVLEYDRYEPPLGARSYHKYFVLWQDVKISIYYVNHVLVVILRRMRTFKSVFKILIVQIRGWGRTLHLTEDMNDQMGDYDFQAKGWVLTFCQKTKHIQTCT